MQADLFRDALSLESVLRALRDCVGAAHGLTARALVLQITGRRSGAGERRLRQIVETLRLAGHPVCGHPSHGYYMAANADELAQTCQFLVSRSMTSLQQVRAMKRVTLPDLLGQLALSIGANHDHESDE